MLFGRHLQRLEQDLSLKQPNPSHPLSCVQYRRNQCGLASPPPFGRPVRSCPEVQMVHVAKAVLGSGQLRLHEERSILLLPILQSHRVLLPSPTKDDLTRRNRPGHVNGLPCAHKSQKWWLKSPTHNADTLSSYTKNQIQNAYPHGEALLLSTPTIFRSPSVQDICEFATPFETLGTHQERCHTIQNTSRDPGVSEPVIFAVRPNSPTYLCFQSFVVAWCCPGASFWVTVVVFVLTFRFGRCMHFFIDSVALCRLFLHVLCLCQFFFPCFGSAFWVPVFV
jgi:hypothetical protein